MTVNSEFYSNRSRRKRILHALPDPIYIFIAQQGHSMRFCVDVRDDDVRTEAETLIHENGGLVEDDSVPISPFTTILVQEDASPDEYDRVVFHVRYLLDCILQRSLLPLGPYAVGRTITDTFYDVIYYRTKVYKNLRIYDVVETDDVARYEMLAENDEPTPSPQTSKRSKTDDSDSTSSTKFIRKKAKVSLNSTTEAESSENHSKKRKFESTSEDDSRPSTAHSKDSKIEDSLSKNDKPSAVKHRELGKVPRKDSTSDDSSLTSRGTHSKESEIEDSSENDETVVKSRKLDHKKVTQKDSTSDDGRNRSKDKENSSEDDSFKSSVSEHTKDSTSRKLHSEVHCDSVKAQPRKESPEDSDSCSTVDLEAEMAKNMSQRRIRRKVNASSKIRKTVIDSDSTSDECDKDTSNGKPEKPCFKASSKIDDFDSSSSEPDERSKIPKKSFKMKKIRQEKSKKNLKSDETNETITLNDSEMIEPSKIVLHEIEDSPVVIVRQKRKKAKRIEIVVLSSDSESCTDADQSVVVIQESDDDSANEVLKVNKKAGSSKKGNELLQNVKEEQMKSSEHTNGERSEKVAKDQKLSRNKEEESRSTNSIVNDKKDAANKEESLKIRNQKSPERKNDEEKSQKTKEDKCSTNKEEESCSSNLIGNDRKGATNPSQKSAERRNNEMSQAKDQKELADKEVVPNLPGNNGKAANIQESDKASHDETQNCAKTIEEKQSKVGEGSSSRNQEVPKSLEKSALGSTSKKSGEEDDGESAKEGEKSTKNSEQEKEAEKVNGITWIAPLEGIVKSRPIRSVEHCVNDPELDIPSKSTLKSAPPRRRPYARREQEAILMYIVRKNAHLGSLRSDVIWRKMEKANVCRDRTWQSLKNHFLKTLVHELDRYSFLSSDEKELMRGKKK